MSPDGVPDWVVEVPLAHRGLHHPAGGHGAAVPENSLAAFRAAADAGVGMELDVRLTRDDVAVVAHDRSLLRTTGADLLVDRCAHDELADLRLEGTGEHLPTLAEALAAVDGRVPVMVEVKNEGLRAGRVEAAALEVLRGYDGPACVASFNPLTVGWFLRNEPRLLRAQTGGADDALPAVVRRALTRMLQRGFGRPDFLSWNVARLDDGFVTDARADGVPVVAWTVRTPEQLVAARAGADNWIFEGLPVADVSA